MNLSDINVPNMFLSTNGVAYVVTWDTGEHHYGELGGGAAFAYLAEDVLRMPQLESYADFCAISLPVGEDDPNWRELAWALARAGKRLCVAGVCIPALTDSEYQAARRAQ
jgi:hypothetical protein